MANPVYSNLQRLTRKMKKEAHKGLLFHFAEREGFTLCIPLRPGGGATNSMNDTDVPIVSFLCASALSKLKPSHKKMKRLRLAS